MAGGPAARPARWPARLAPWLAVLAFWLWSAWPLLLWTDTQAFAGKLTTDNVVSAWFYDYASRALAEGWDLQTLQQLNHPRPHATSVEFPAVLDAVLAAPLGWLLGWPRQWGAAQALALLVNGLGGAALARSLGARGLGTVAAGCLAILCRPVWKDLVMARMNAVWPGLGALALAGMVGALTTRRFGAATACAVGAAVCGAAAAAIYPPGLLLLAPFGLALLLGPLAEARWGRRALALGSVALGLALAAPELGRIAATRSGQAGLGQLGCPDRWAALNAVDLWRTLPDGFQGLSEPALVVTSWALAPLVLLHRRRWSGLLAVALVAAGLALSLGPCTEWTEGVRWDLGATAVVGPLLVEAWRLAGPLHDFSRFAGVAVLIAGVLTGLGLDGLAGRGRLRWVLAAALGGAVVGHVQWVVLSERLAPAKWHDASPPATARFLAALPPEARGPAAELPFDRKQQFLSLIGAPEPPRLNPLRPGDHPPVQQPIVEWIYALGWGQLRDLPADPPALDPSRVRWVFYDAGRCRAGGVRPSACDPAVVESLTAVLGPARALDEGTLVWTVGAWPDGVPAMELP